MDADGGARPALVGPHLLQHLQDGRDGLRHAVVRPRDVMQLFQSPATLEKKMKTAFPRLSKSLGKRHRESEAVCDVDVSLLMVIFRLSRENEPRKQYLRFYKSPVTSLSHNRLCFPQNPAEEKKKQL